MYLPATTDRAYSSVNLKQLGEDVAEQPEFVLASFRLIRHARTNLTCACLDVILQVRAPSRPEHGIAGLGLLSHVLVAKFPDRLPMYRQSAIYARESVDLDWALLVTWLCGATALLRQLVDAIRKHAMAARKLTADDTLVPVLPPGNGKSKSGAYGLI